MQVVARSQAGVTVSASELSGGAKEQLAIVTRFAIAQLVAADKRAGSLTHDGGSVPVVIDDALGATDAGRLGRIATLFREVGKRSQVIVLTCNYDRYARVPGAIAVDFESLRGTGSPLSVT